MKRNIRCAACWLVGVLFVAGCQRPLNYEKTFRMEPGDVQAFPVDAPQREQKVRVEVTTSGVLLNVYVVRAQDEEAARQALLSDRKPTSSLAKTEITPGQKPSTSSVASGLDATIPAKTGFTVLLNGATKSCDVTLKITGR